MKIRYSCSVCLMCILLVWSKGHAQDLIPNGDFEHARTCNAFMLFDSLVYSWYSPVWASPDYFNSCMNSPTRKVPANFMGMEAAHSGSAYAGISTSSYQDYSEYIQTKLSSPLVAGQRYTFEMHLSMGDSACWGINIGALFTTSPVVSPTQTHLVFTPQVTTPAHILQKSGWVQVTGDFIATGGESYITLGNFEPAMSTTGIPGCLSSTSHINGTYYYVDDVKLECVTKVQVPFMADTVFMCKMRDSVQFSAGSYGAQKYLWSTGATTSSTKVGQPGVYTVRMKDASSACTLIDSVVVLPSPSINFNLGPDRPLCQNSTVTLSTLTPANAYLWSNGSTDDQITINTTGPYWLEVTNKTCKHRDTVHIYPSPLNLLNLGNDLTLCENSGVTLNASSSAPGATSFYWSTNETRPSINISKTGTYWVRVQDNLCAATDSISIAFKPNPEINLGSDTSLCNPDSLLLKVKNSNASYQWNTGSTAQSVYINQTGIYTVRAEENGCISHDTIIVMFQNPPAVDLGKDTTLCEENKLVLEIDVPGAAYKWSTGSGEASIIISAAGKYMVEVTRGSCIAKDSIIVYQQPKPHFDLGQDIALCPGELLVLQAPAADAYLWQNGSGQPGYTVNEPGWCWLEISRSSCKARDSILIIGKPAPVINLGNDSSVCKETTVNLDAGNNGCIFKWNDASASQTRKVKAPGIFAVTVTNMEGCSATDSIRLDTFASPWISLGPDSFVCEGNTLLLDAGNAYQYYTWQDGSEGSHIKVSQAGTYAVTVTSQHHCKATDSIMIQVKPLPVIPLQRYIDACNPDFIMRLPASYTHYQWQDGSETPAFHVKEYGQYSVTVTDANHCTNTAVVDVKNNCPATVYIPNAFTPLNTDGINDVFLPVTHNVKTMHFQVYNRWGQLLFETNEPGKGWDGLHKDEYSLADVYIYKITYTGMDDQTHTAAGDFTLLK